MNFNAKLTRLPGILISIVACCFAIDSAAKVSQPKLKKDITQPVDIFQLRLFEVQVPRCTSQTFIDASREGFTTIANNLSGRSEYNELIRMFRRGDWEKLDTGIKEFQSLFESSPLQEAVAFLRVESLFDRVENSDSPIIKEAEKSLRETLLLYPRSKLIPAVQGAIGAFWLRNGMFEKSLALFMDAREEHPLHPLSCLFQFGIAENNFLLNKKDAARKSFQALLQKCKNARLVVGSRMRLIDIDSDKNPNEASTQLLELYEAESNIISRYYPSALYNLGEIKYRAGEFPSAQFYFNEYLTHKNKSLSCSSYALRRQADIALKSKNSLDKVVGLYLEAHEQYPQTDIGKFSYVQAMLMDYSSQSKGEQIRRTQVIDEASLSIQDSRLRGSAAMLKAITMLDLGAPGAVEYMLKASNQSPAELKASELANLIMPKFLKALKDQALIVIKEDRYTEIEKTEDLLRPFETSFENWFKTSPYESEAKSIYKDLVLQRFSQLTKKNEWGIAIALLGRWKNSPLWGPSETALSTKDDIGSQVATALMEVEEKSEAETKLIKEITKGESILSSFLSERFFSLFAFAHLKQNESAEVSSWVKKMKDTREVASKKSNISVEVNDFLEIKKAEVYMDQKQFGESDKILKDIKSKRFFDRAAILRIESLKVVKKYNEAYQFGISVLGRLNEDSSKKIIVTKMVPVVNDSKLWSNAVPLLELAKKQKVAGKELFPFLFLAGKAQEERKLYESAISYLTQGLSLDPQNEKSTEAKFRLGKCYKKEDKIAKARKEWQEVADLNDPFWSPLANSEINLLY